MSKQINSTKTNSTLNHSILNRTFFSFLLLFSITLTTQSFFSDSPLLNSNIQVLGEENPQVVTITPSLITDQINEQLEQLDFLKKDCNHCIQPKHIQNNSISSNKIKNKSLLSSDIASNQINSRTIKDLSIQSEDLTSSLQDTINQAPLFSRWNKSSGIEIQESQITDLQNYLTSYSETDPIFSSWNKSTGITITESQISNLQSYLTTISGLNISLLTNNTGYITNLSSFTTDNLTQGTTNKYTQWTTNGTTISYSNNVGIGTTTPTESLHLSGNIRSNNYIGSGNRCVYVDLNGVLRVKSEDCGTSSGGDNLGNHTLTQNIIMGNNWISGDGDNEGFQISSTGILSGAQGNISMWTNDSNYLTSYTETDPIFTAWNKSTGISITESQISNLQSYLTSYTETDPIFTAHQANNITASHLIILGNTSNTNTGDETTSTIKTKLGSSSTSTDGYLTSTDWNIFNNKQPAGSYLTSYTETDPIYIAWNKSTGISITESQISNLQAYITDGNTNWNNSYGFITDLSTFTTDNLTQGTTNLYSQWATSGSNISFSGGNVGIGTGSPGAKLNVYDILLANTYVDSVAIYQTYTNTDSGTDYPIAFDAMKIKYSVADGVIANGYQAGVVAQTYVSDTNFAGTITDQRAIWARSGIYTAATTGARTVTNAYGIYIEGLESAGTIINHYGVYQSGAGKNYFGGNVGIGTTNPVNKLQISSIGSSNYSGNDFALGNGTGAFAIYQTNTATNFYTNSGAYAFNTGNVGIGTMTPGYKLTVQGTNTADAVVVLNGSGYPAVALRPNTVGLISLYDGASSPTEKVAIRADSSSTFFNGGGNVGIGTTDPTGQMAGTTGIGIYNSNYPAIGFKNSNTNWLLYGTGTTFRMWNASAGEILTANTSGNVGIGTISPELKFDVSGDAQIRGYVELSETDGLRNGLIATYKAITGSGSDRSLAIFTEGGGNGDDLHFMTGGSATSKMTILSGGNVGIGTAIPTAKLDVNGTIRQGPLVARPLATWSVAGDSAGAVLIKLPGTVGNYGMVHMEINTYEYNSNTATTYICGGHNWGGAWHNYGCSTNGTSNKKIRLAIKDGQYTIVIGEYGSGWSYGHVVLSKITNAGYYSGTMDLGGAYSITQDNSSEAYTWISGDLNRFNSGNGYFTGDVSAASFTDRTPYPKDLQMAYDSVLSMQRLPDGEYDENNKEQQLDHSLLSPFVQSNGGYRDLSASVSSINEVTKYLLNQVGGLHSNFNLNSFVQELEVKKADLSLLTTNQNTIDQNFNLISNRITELETPLTPFIEGGGIEKIETIETNFSQLTLDTQQLTTDYTNLELRVLTLETTLAGIETGFELPAEFQTLQTLLLEKKIEFDTEGNLKVKKVEAEKMKTQELEIGNKTLMRSARGKCFEVSIGETGEIISAEIECPGTEENNP